MPSQKVKFTNPPVEEVVFDLHLKRLDSIQFVHLAEIWNLYRSDFPNVQEMPPLPTSSEDFEAPWQQQNLALTVSNEVNFPHLWFLAEDDASLIQFQPDRFIYNWRKREALPQYPSYSRILPLFEKLARQLGSWVEGELDAKFNIRQIEIRYINSISHQELQSLDDISSIFGRLNFALEGLQFSSVQPEHHGHERRVGRVLTELNSSRSDDDKSYVHWLSLTGKGRPDSESLSDAMKLMDFMHEVLTNHFAEISTDKAKRIWGYDES